MAERQEGPLWQHPDVMSASERWINPYHVLREAIELPRQRHRAEAGREAREIISRFIDDARAGLPEEVNIGRTPFVMDINERVLYRIDEGQRTEASDIDWYQRGHEVLTYLVTRVADSGINYGF